jgi:hypothetical protein
MKTVFFKYGKWGIKKSVVKVHPKKILAKKLSQKNGVFG